MLIYSSTFLTDVSFYLAVFTREQLKVPTRRPAGGYLTFVAEQFAKQPKVSTSEGARERTRNIAAQWRTLTEQEQQVG